MTDKSSAPRSLLRITALLVESLWLATVLLVPLAVNPWGLAYELPKAALLRALTLLMLAAHFVALAWSSTLPDPRNWLCAPLVRPILLVAVTIALSTLTSISPLVSLWGSYQRQQGAYLMLCFILWALLVANHLRTPAQRRRLAITVALAGSLVALTPFVESLYRHENPLTWRPGGSLGNPIFLGAYLIMTVPFTLAGLMQHALRFRHYALRITFHALRISGWAAALALQLTALLITQSRGPWVGALVGLALFGALVLWPTHRRLVLAGLVALVLLGGMLLAGLNFGLTPPTRLTQLPYVGRIVELQNPATGTARVRLVLWQAAARVVTTWPEVGLTHDRLHVLRPLLGYGPDTASIVYTANYPPELAHIEDPGAIWDRAHNEPLDVLTMQGWLGLGALGILGVACARRGLALWRAACDAAGRSWAAAPLAALLAHAVEVQFAFTLTATGLMAWLCVAWLATSPSPTPFPSSEFGSKEGARGWGEVLRWRIYAVVGAALLVLAAVRVEGGLLWADTLAARTVKRRGSGKESLVLYEQALALIPWQATYYEFRAQVLYHLAQAQPDDQVALKTDLLAAADRSLARARQLEPLELEYYSNAGILHAYWSQAVDPTHLETAIAFYEQAFRLAPTRAELYTDLGHIYHNHGLYEEALAQYRIALEIDPRFVQAHYSSGLAWQALGRRDLARQAFRTALDLAPGCNVCREALAGLGE